MKKLLFLLAALSAQAQLVTLSDTLTNAVGGGAYTGRITVNLSSPGSAQPLYYSTTSLAGWQYILCVGVVGGDCSATTSAGAISIPLYANSTITPAGTSYAVTYSPTKGSGWKETWVVGVSTTKLYDIRANTVPTPTTLFQESQLRLSQGSLSYGASTGLGAELSIGSAGQVLGVSGGLPAWIAPPACATCVVTGGSYADPAWITSLAGSKVSGNISGNAATATSATTAAVSNAPAYRYLLRDWDAAVSKRQWSATGTPTIAYIGDSWVNNEYITGPLRDRLQNLYGNSGPGYANADSWSMAPNGITKASAGTWTDTHGTSGSYGVTASDTSTTDSSTPASKSFTANATSYVIHYVKKTNGGRFTYAIDGGSATTVNTADTAIGYGTTTVSGLSNASHTIAITYTGSINSVPISEPASLSDVGNYTAGITTAAFTEGGLSGGVQFPATTGITEFARPYISSLATSTAYTLSVYVVMNDGSAPNPVESTSSGDFALIIDNGFTGTPTVELVSGSLYRVSGTRTTGGSIITGQVGINRYTGQSGKAFRVTGYQIVTGATAQNYAKTPASLTLLGVDAQNSTAGVRLHRLANPGATAANYAAVNASMWQAALTALNPNVVVFQFGVNELLANATPASQSTALATLATWARTAMPYADILFVPPVRVGATGTYTIDDYATAQKALADSAGYAYYSSINSIGTYSDGNARGLYANTTHLNSSGGGVVGNNLYRWLTTTAP